MSQHSNAGLFNWKKIPSTVFRIYIKITFHQAGFRVGVELT